MTTLNVDGLTFRFRAGSDVSKYDEWSFYRNQFSSVCGGVKAVDLIYLDTQGEAWLIEVKDYRVYPRTKTIPIPDEIAQKVRDTLAGVLAASKNASDAAEKAFANRLLQARRFRIVLHLEPRPNPSRLYNFSIDKADIEMKLKQLLKAIDPHPKVVDMSGVRNLNWTVI